MLRSSGLFAFLLGHDGLQCMSKSKTCCRPSVAVGKLSYTTIENSSSSSSSSNNNNNNNDNKPMTIPPPANKHDIFANSWTSAAPGYDKLFVPRFSPWTEDAISALSCHADDIKSLLLQRRHKNGGVGIGRGALIPCCGPGQELSLVAHVLGPDIPVLGVDIAPGMIEIARRRCAEMEGDGEGIRGRKNVWAAVGDCMHPPTGPYCAIFSIFGLQQLPDPANALRVWVNELVPGGVAVISIWPSRVEDEGPWARWETLARKKLAEQQVDKTNAGNKSRSGERWEEKLVKTAASAGAEILEDRTIAHEIKWDNPSQFWDAMTRSGPWHKVRLTRGDAFVDELKEEVCSIYPPDRPLIHSPRARMIVLRRRS